MQNHLLTQHVTGSAEDTTDDDQQRIESRVSLGESVERSTGLGSLTSGDLGGLQRERWVRRCQWRPLGGAYVGLGRKGCHCVVVCAM